MGLGCYILCELHNLLNHYHMSNGKGIQATVSFWRIYEQQKGWSWRQ